MRRVTREQIAHAFGVPVELLGPPPRPLRMTVVWWFALDLDDDGVPAPEIRLVRKGNPLHIDPATHPKPPSWAWGADWHIDLDAVQ